MDDLIPMFNSQCQDPEERHRFIAKMNIICRKRGEEEASRIIQAATTVIPTENPTARRSLSTGNDKSKKVNLVGHGNFKKTKGVARAHLIKCCHAQLMKDCDGKIMQLNEASRRFYSRQVKKVIPCLMSHFDGDEARFVDHYGEDFKPASFVCSCAIPQADV